MNLLVVHKAVPRIDGLWTVVDYEQEQMFGICW